MKKAEEYLATAEDSFDLERYTPAAGDAIHAGINAKDAIVTVLTGSTNKSRDHSVSSRELRRALGQHPNAARAEQSLRQLITMKSDVEYGITLLTAEKTGPPIRRAQMLVDLAVELVRLGR